MVVINRPSINLGHAVPNYRSMRALDLIKLLVPRRFQPAVTLIFGLGLFGISTTSLTSCSKPKTTEGMKNTKGYVELSIADLVATYNRINSELTLCNTHSLILDNRLGKTGQEKLNNLSRALAEQIIKVVLTRRDTQDNSIKLSLSKLSPNQVEAVIQLLTLKRELRTAANNNLYKFFSPDQKKVYDKICKDLKDADPGVLDLVRNRLGGKIVLEGVTLDLIDKIIKHVQKTVAKGGTIGVLASKDCVQEPKLILFRSLNLSDARTVRKMKTPSVTQGKTAEFKLLVGEANFPPEIVKEISTFKDKVAVKIDGNVNILRWSVEKTRNGNIAIKIKVSTDGSSQTGLRAATLELTGTNYKFILANVIEVLQGRAGNGGHGSIGVMNPTIQTGDPQNEKDPCKKKSGVFKSACCKRFNYKPPSCKGSRPRSGSGVSVRPPRPRKIEPKPRRKSPCAGKSGVFLSACKKRYGIK